MYLDPGFGGMLVQIIVALVAAGGAMAFAMRKKIKSWFGKSKTNDDSTKAAANTTYNIEDDVIDTLSDNND